MAVLNAMSVDLEEWFSVYNFSKHFTREQWRELEQRSMQSTIKLLDLFDTYQVKSTFFVLGWVAEQNPELIQEIARRGHEIASHGYSHQLVKVMGEEAFRVDMAKSMEVISKAVSTDIIGFRAPSFSVDPAMTWIFDILRENGIKYDSSIFPVAFHPDYANSGTPLEPYDIAEGIREFPMTCIPTLGLNLPCSGGGYFRMLPYKWFKYGFRYCAHKGRPAVFYLHPWEVDPDQPRISAIPAMKRFRHYVNLDKTLDRLERLISDFPFTTMKRVLGYETP